MQRRMLTLISREEDAFRRDVFEPGHFTASAFVLSPARDALLLIFHGKLQRWLQPGGHVEAADSDVLAAARREAAEETGLDALTLEVDGIFDVDIHRIPARPVEPAHEHFDVRFLFRAPSLSHRAGSDAKRARWVGHEEVSRMESDASVMRAVAKAFPR